MTSEAPLLAYLQNWTKSLSLHDSVLIQGRLKSGILTRYACATKTNALGYEKIIVISFVGMQKL